MERPRTYVGQTDNLLRRFEDHRKSAWWTDAVVFTSTDLSLNIAHVRFLEAKLIERASQVGRCILDNKNKPQGSQLSKADTEIAKQFLDNMLLCLPVLGVSFFEKSRPSEKRRVLFLKLRGEVIATGYYMGEGKLQVQAGAKAFKRASIPANITKRRARLVEQGILKDQGAAYELVRVHTFDSPSGASDVLLGPTNGRRVWKDESGVPLDELEPRPKAKS